MESPAFTKLSEFSAQNVVKTISRATSREGRAMREPGAGPIHSKRRQSFPVRGRVRGWFYRLEELPSGFWQVRGRDRFGHTVNVVGASPEEVLSSAEDEAQLLSDALVPAG